MPTEKRYVIKKENGLIVAKENFSVDAAYYQVRNIDARTWGLFHPDDNPHEARWWGENGYRAFHRNAAQQFESPKAADDFRTKQFSKKG